ncbi:MAG: hypothetical protein RMK18_12570, partial [Armatimonadota bacterium]|nr:hypothetical protein [Armatimonadota bacterium]
MIKGEQKGLLLVIFVGAMFISTSTSSPPGGRTLKLPKANAEAERKLKEAYACYVQGWYERAIDIANEVYSKYGDVQAKWFPSWVKRAVKGKIPNPYDKSEVLGRTLEGGFLFTMAIESVFPSYLIARCYAAIGDTEGFARWAKNLRKLGFDQDAVSRAYLLPHPSGYLRETVITKNTWRPLALSFREEDYFILVPLDDACKVLGLSYRLDISP